MQATIPTIISVKDLIETLRNKPDGLDYLSIMNAIDIPQAEFEKFYTWSDDHYTRNSLVRTDEFELLLICWEKGQSSPIHDFDSREAWIHTIRGRLTEERFTHKESGLEKVSSVLLGTTEFSYMTDPIAIHRYSNSYESRSVSLNLYAGPVEKWKEYDPESARVREKKVSYDRVYQFDEEGNVHSY